MKELTKKTSRFKVLIDGQLQTGHFNVWPAFFIYIKRDFIYGKGIVFEFHPFNAMLGIWFVFKNHSK
jgi:hypothetical protein